MNITYAAFGTLALFCAAFASAQETRLSNLAIRAETGAEPLITGFTIGPGPNKTVLLRAVGPTLGTFGVTGTLADPKLELYSGSTKIAENDNWRAIDASSFTSVGAFPLGAESRDAALVAELAPGSYTAQVSGLGADAGVTLVELYEVSAGTTRLVNLSTRAHVGTGDRVLVPGITIAPGAGTRRLLLRAIGPTLAGFGVTAVLENPKLMLYSGQEKAAENDDWGTPIGVAGATAQQLSVAFNAAGAFALPVGSRDAALLTNLTPGSYTLEISGAGNTTGTALVEVYDLTPPPPAKTLFIAQLRPENSAVGSTAYGYATILLGEGGTWATVSVSFSNLSATQTSGYLRIGDDPVFSLSLGQVSGRLWTFAPTAAYSSAQIIDALKTGRLSVALDSAKFPGGEARGTFIVARGSATFTPPPQAPALPAAALTSPTRTDAARLLTQATFGPTTSTINEVMARGINGWIEHQMALPASSLFAGIKADITAFPNPLQADNIFNPRTHRSNLSAAWFKIASTAPDQLRQRVAFALSEIFVIGDMGFLNSNPEMKTKYYDLLVDGAFGSYRELLENITLDSAMGMWLSHWANPKADPAKGTSPDENYAREIHQLFSIGLVQLQPDGTLMLDGDGQPIPTYDLNTITETAKVFTGWASAIASATTTNIASFTTRPYFLDHTTAGDDQPSLKPMRYFDAFHDKTEKRIIGLEQVPLTSARPTFIPANQSGPQDLKILLDTLANHPNTGPFICRRLIQRLVTSNPSSGYLHRVASVFANDGTGVRGNLGAVIRAILTDYEARSPHVLNNIGYGKIKEPLIRATSLIRAVNLKAPNGRYLDSFFGDPRGGNGHRPSSILAFPGGSYGFSQEPLNSLTVFNFFSPDYTLPGPLASAGLVAPELEITDTISALQIPNNLNGFLTRDVGAFPLPPIGPSPYLVPDYSEFLPNAKNPTALADQLNLLFCASQMTSATRTLLVTALQTLPAGATDVERVQSALQITLTSPDGAMQK